jgi:hypothetical protein
LFNVGSAVFSECGRYRYRLTRDGIGQVRDRVRTTVTWIMLNPSTADASEDDPTIRRVRGFSRRAGHHAFIVVNLYALRATDPAELARHDSPCGPDNDAAILAACQDATQVVCAWGAHSMAPPRARAVEHLLDGIPLFCLGFTKEGEPRHPLYVAGTQDLVPYENAAAQVVREARPTG